jgi:hypothetical protein
LGRGLAVELEFLQEAAADDHLLDLGGALADQEHGGVAVEALDLELGGVAVPAVNAQRVLDDFLAVLRGEVLGQAGLQVSLLAGVPWRGRP